MALALESSDSKTVSVSQKAGTVSALLAFTREENEHPPHPLERAPDGAVSLEGKQVSVMRKS